MSGIDHHTPPAAWIVTDGKAGDETQCRGVADAMGLNARIIRVNPRPPWSWLAAATPVTVIDPRDRPDRSGSVIMPPFPDIAIGSGRRAVGYLQTIKAASGGDTFTVFLKDPRVGTGAADIIWVPEHDELRGDTVITSITGPHGLTAARLMSARAAPRADILGLPGPRVAVLVGGQSRNHRFAQDDINRFVGLLKEHARAGAHYMITTSSRTPAPLVEALAETFDGPEHLLWSGKGENPYIQFLANADQLIVTADSTNMLGEAVATGRPVHYFEPSGGHRKITRLIDSLIAAGALHPLKDGLKTDTYQPIDSTPVIAAAIRKAYERFRRARQPKSQGTQTI